MNGWWDLGAPATLLHLDDGQLWLQTLFERDILVLDLVHGRVLGRPFHGSPADFTRSFPCPGGLLHQVGRKFYRLSVDGVLWERPGFVITADHTHILYGADRQTAVVLDMRGNEVGRVPMDLESLGEPFGSLWPVALSGGELFTSVQGRLRRHDFAGRAHDEHPIGEDTYLCSLAHGLVVVEHHVTPEGHTTSLTGAIDAVVRGRVGALAGEPDRWVAQVVFHDARHEAVFATDGHVESAPIESRGSEPIVLADARTRLVAGSDGCVWHAGDGLRSLHQPPERWTQFLLWDGFVIALLEQILTPLHPGGVPRWTPPAPTHVVQGRVDEVFEDGTLRLSYEGEPRFHHPWTAQDEQDTSPVLAPATATPPLEGAVATLELREGPLGIVLDAWTTATAAWCPEPSMDLAIEGGPVAVDEHRVAEATLMWFLEHGPLEEPLFRFLCSPEPPLGLRPCRARLPDPFLIPFASGPREEIYAAARWPLTRSWGVAVQEPDRVHPIWLCDSVHAFFDAVEAGRLPRPEGEGPDWFTLAHRHPAADLLEVTALDDAIERERRLAHTPWHWGSDFYAGLSRFRGQVEHPVALPLDDRIAWQRRRVHELLQASEQPTAALDTFFADLAERGPLFTTLAAHDLHLVGPPIGGGAEVPLPEDPRSPEVRFMSGRYVLPLPCAHRLLGTVHLWVWPPAGSVLIELPNHTETPRFLSLDPERDLARLPEVLASPSEPPAWFRELFGDLAPTCPTRTAFAAWVQDPSQETRASVIAAFLQRGWEAHAAAMHPG